MEGHGRAWGVGNFQLSSSNSCGFAYGSAEDFALMEASYAIIRILQNFPNIRLPPGIPSEPVGTEGQIYTIGLVPADGVQVLLC